MSDAIKKQSILSKYYGWLWSGLGLLFLFAMLALGLLTLNKANLNHDKQISYIKNIKLIANFNFTDINDIKTYLQPLLDKKFVELNLAQVETMLKQHPWIRQSVLQKKWPDTLLVKIEEQVPVAILKSGGYLNSRAQAFDEKQSIRITDLPIIESDSENYIEIIKNYSKLAEVLKPKQKITKIKYEKIGRYDFSLANGTKVILGRRQLDKRIKKLPQVFQYLEKNKMSEVHMIDMRYRNAVAVKFEKHSPLRNKERI